MAASNDVIRFVRVGTLDDPGALPPDIHIYTRSKLPWVRLPEGVPAVEVYYDSKASSGRPTASRGATARWGWPDPLPSLPGREHGLQLLQIALQPVEQAGGALGIGADPAVVDALDRHRVEMVPALPPLAADDDQPGFLEHAEMLHHRAAIERREACDEIAGGARLGSSIRPATERRVADARALKILSSAAAFDMLYFYNI